MCTGYPRVGDVYHTGDVNYPDLMIVKGPALSVRGQKTDKTQMVVTACCPDCMGNIEFNIHQLGMSAGDKQYRRKRIKDHTKNKTHKDAVNGVWAPCEDTPNNDDAVKEVEDGTDSVGDDCLCDIVQGCTRPRNHPGICNTIILGKRTRTCTKAPTPPNPYVETVATLPDLDVGEIPSRADVLETHPTAVGTIRIRPTDLPRVIVDSLLEHLHVLRGIPTIDNNGQMTYMNVKPYVGRRTGLNRGYQVQVKVGGKLRWFGTYEHTFVGAVVACAVRLDTTIVDKATAHAWIYTMLNDVEAVTAWITKVTPMLSTLPKNRMASHHKCQRVDTHIIEELD